jgi:ADP-heptose:LPS heptosyltransferase
MASIIERGITSARPPEHAPIAIHPGSGSPDKCWPLDSYVTLIQRLNDAGHPCKILLGEVELERFTPDQIKRVESAAHTIRRGTYLGLADELSSSSAFVGNDTGPAHLAAIIGLPTLTLFGPTNPETWKPLGPNVNVLHKQPISSLTLDEVQSFVMRQLPMTNDK